MKSPKQPKPIRTLVIWLVVLAVLTGAALYGKDYIANLRTNALEDRIAEVEAHNREEDAKYAAAMADFQSSTASGGGANLAWPAASPDGWDVVDLTNYPLESPYNESRSRADMMNTGMLLVNQWHSRPDDFAEEGLVSVGSYTGGKIQVDDYSVRLFPVVIGAFQNALTDAAAIGLQDYMIQEGYRSYDDQDKLFQKKVESLSKRYSGDELLAKAAEDVNYPGTSEYNTGLSFRLRLYNRTDKSVGQQQFSSSDQGVWLAENCWKYGIVFRFPLADFPLKGTADKSYKTGISTKMNLYRYVGMGNAAVMHVKDFCLEEYIEYLQEHPHIAVFEDGILKYEIVRQMVGDSDPVSLQLSRRAPNWTASLDNMGGVIIVFAY